ncbi:hypothetical protein GBA52_008750 [Prunus armeniaca]|nr:hypothetical protein GBA52_008750 [Prunus armeniaca]
MTTTRSHPPNPPPPNEPRTPARNHPDSLPLPHDFFSPCPDPKLQSPPTNYSMATTLSPSFRARSSRHRRFPARSDVLHLSLLSTLYPLSLCAN